MVKRTQRKTSPGNIRKLVEGKESLEANFAELSVLVPDMQTALDSDDVPLSVKREKVDFLSSLLEKIRVFSPLLTSEQCNKLMEVSSLVQKFKQLERRGNKKSLKKVQINLSTFIGDLAGPVHYRVVTPPPQPDRQDAPPVTEQPGKLSTKEQVPSSRPVEVDGSDKFSFDLSVDPGDPIN